ncbi:MAG: penicillin-binding protein 1C [Rhizobiaceae bacterium]
MRQAAKFRFWWNTGFVLAAALIVAATALLVLNDLDQRYPPPLQFAGERSVEFHDRDGRLLRAYATSDGRWRLHIDLDDVDPQFIDMLIAYEDKRFWDHRGIDPWAMLRAASQMIANHRIVSGGSTLTMQLARLIEPREGRSIVAKLRQMARAIQIERRLTKAEILQAYLSLAPYGGNLEGVRAASLSWFGKEPKKLRLSEAALLVALPQLPELRRPDRHPGNAKRARDRVLTRMADAEVIARSEIERATRFAVPRTKLAMPAYAPHLADLARSKMPDAPELASTLDRDIQARLEHVARTRARKLGPTVSVAIMVADARTGHILAEVGSSDYFDDRRFGWIGMSRAIRSPGSALKPFIYGLAMQEGFAAPETIISDRPASFHGYRPRNFDKTYQGDVPVRLALQMSLNVPALHLLDAVGPARLANLFDRAGTPPQLPRGEAPGLAIGLGGAGFSLKDLVQGYTAFPNLGLVSQLGNGVDREPGGRPSKRILEPAAAWHVSDILSGVNRPSGSATRKIAYKTGTSYGYRDAWSIGFDGRYVIGVWAGSADNRSIPGLTGISAAAPILFEAFAKSGLAPVPLPAAPAGALRLTASELPAGLQRFSSGGDGLVPVGLDEAPPRFVYPPDGARISLTDSGRADIAPLVMKLQGGKAPFRWLANGELLDERSRRRQGSWVPDGRGHSNLTVIDAEGRAASINVFID